MNKAALKSDRLSQWADYVLVAIVFVYSVIFIVHPEYFFVDDCFFYFEIAYNFAHGLGSTFNEVTLTNGYHPLWMLLCAAIFAAGAGKIASLHLIAAVIVLLNLGTLAFLMAVLRRLGVLQWHLGGAALIAFLFGTQLGSEGALSAFFLSASLYAATRLLDGYSLPRFVLANALLDFAVLSRLDNVFICALLGVGILAFALRGHKIKILVPAIIAAASIHVLLLGSYLATNIIYFHSLVPISGMLKNNFNDAHALGSNIPNIGKASLVISLLCATFLWKEARKNPFYVYVLAPMIIGVIIHATYIIFFMSSETRWTWYYTSWVILASLYLCLSTQKLLSGPKALKFPHSARSVQRAVQIIACAMPILWAVRILPDKFEPSEAAWISALEAAVPAENGVRRVFAFDYPGKIAYYSSMQVLAADGLTEDLEFQRDLAAKGLFAYLAGMGIEIFIGPPLVLDTRNVKEYCGKIYLGSTRFECVVDSTGNTVPVRVEFFSRLPFKPAGEMALPRDQTIWSGKFAAWKIK